MAAAKTEEDKDAHKIALVDDSDPWSDVGNGSDLHIGDFLTFRLTRLANAARCNVTRRYLADFDLNAAEWRLLAEITLLQPVRFSALVANCSMDKGQAHRTLRDMIKRGYIVSWSPAPAADKVGETGVLPVLLTVTSKGRSLYKAVLPLAQLNQVRLLQKLTRNERRTLYRVLGKLYNAIGTHELPEHD